MKFVAPNFNEKSFNCPLCGTFSHMNWDYFAIDNTLSGFYQACCSCCSAVSIWKATEHQGFNATKGFMIFPDVNSSPLPADDMPQDVKTDYIEAASIFSRSPRGAAALLRLGLQKLCKHLGEKGKNIDQDIRSLATKNVLPPLVVRVADTVRITGNNAVHPGEMDEHDFDFVASKMFELLNFIVKKGISEPRELEELYQLTPEAPRQNAEAKDLKSKSNA
jgi:hypothetical protein